MRLRGQIYLSATSGLRWDGTHLTVGSSLNEAYGIYRYLVLGDRLKHRGLLSLGGIKYIGRYWLKGSKIIATPVGGSGGYAPMYLYDYPRGGNPIKTIGEGVVPPSNETSVTVSVAPT